MRYGLYYNYHGVGDVLLIKFSDETPNKIDKRDDVVLLYFNDKLVGINIFNIQKSVKIKTRGMIVNPPANLLNIINNILINHEIAALPVQNDSGFYVGEILEMNKIKDSDHLHLCNVTLGGDKTYQIVCGANNCDANQKVVVALDDTFMFDGSIIKSGELRGIKSEGMLCSSRELNFPKEEQTPGILILPSDSVLGSDVFK